jgi:hypothetical protein
MSDAPPTPVILEHDAYYWIKSVISTRPEIGYCTMGADKQFTFYMCGNVMGFYAHEVEVICKAEFPKSA